MADTYDLALVQGERFRRGFRWTVDGLAQPLAAYSFRAQVRQKELSSSLLLLDLTPYITLSTDGVTLDLHVPASVLGRLNARAFKETAAWDMFLWPSDQFAEAFLLVQGAVTIDPSSTDMRSGS